METINNNSTETSELQAKLNALPAEKQQSFKESVRNLTARLMNTKGLEKEEAEKNAILATMGAYFPAPQSKTNSGMSGRRIELIREILYYMLNYRKDGWVKVYTKDIAEYLFASGLRSTPTGAPDARSVGDALGKKGLGLLRKSLGEYPLPSKPNDFIHDPANNIIRPSPEEATLDFLCKRFGVDISSETTSS